MARAEEPHQRPFFACIHKPFMTLHHLLVLTNQCTYDFSIVNGLNCQLVAIIDWLKYYGGESSYNSRCKWKLAHQWEIIHPFKNINHICSKFRVGYKKSLKNGEMRHWDAVEYKITSELQYALGQAFQTSHYCVDVLCHHNVGRLLVKI